MVEFMPSRVTVIDSPVAAPGKCCLCGSSDSESRKFVDFGFQLDWYGAVYFCTICFAEIASSIGYVVDKKLEPLFKKLTEDAEYQKSKYEGLVNVLVGAFDDVGVSVDRNAFDAFVNNDDVDESEDVEESSDFSTGGDEISSESSSVKRLGDLFSLGDD